MIQNEHPGYSTAKVGEYAVQTLLATAQDVTNNAGGIAGPIGLGFRVPMIIVSPFSRGGFLCSDVFDHPSILRFLETRFRAEVPNLSQWCLNSRAGIDGLQAGRATAVSDDIGPRALVPGAA